MPKEWCECGKRKPIGGSCPFCGSGGIGEMAEEGRQHAARTRQRIWQAQGELPPPELSDDDLTASEMQAAADIVAKIRAQNAARQKRWRQKNPEKHAANMRRYRDRKKAERAQERGET